MRLLLSSLVAASLLSGPVLAATCARPAEHTALDVAGLKTELMFIALTCDARDKYNAFINRYKTEINADEKAVNTHFSRSYGRSGTKQHDDFITNLANSQSQGGLKQGSVSCSHNEHVFDEVMALRNTGELTEFAAAKMATEQPIQVSDCVGGAPERTTRVATRTKRKR